MSGSRTSQVNPEESCAHSQRLLRPAVLLVVAMSLAGCRAPWQRSTGSEPSFDRLLEIEHQQAGAVGSGLSAGKRPAGPKYPQELAGPSRASETSPRNRNRVRTEDFEEDSDLSSAPPAVREHFERLGQALRNQSEPANKSPEAKDTRSAARRSLADSQDSEQADSETEPTVYRLSDSEDGDSPLPSGAAQLAAKPRPSSQMGAKASDADASSSRRIETEPSVRSAEHQVSGPTAEVNLASGTSETGNPSRRSAEALRTDTTDLAWEDHIREAIHQLNEAKEEASSPSVQVHRAAITRLLSVAIGDLDASMEPIEGLQAAEQDYFKHQFKALYDAVDPAGNPVASQRWSLAMLSQRKAHEQLAAASNLEVSNTAFCTEVESFGVFTKFPTYDFKADQEVLLYCELDNFVSESVKAGFETQLQGRYEIVDSNNRRVADQLLPTDSHVCRNRRRDYFIPYRIYMPKAITAGRYSLKLTIEDMKGHKYGQSKLDFQIVN